MHSRVEMGSSAIQLNQKRAIKADGRLLLLEFSALSAPSRMSLLDWTRGKLEGTISSEACAICMRLLRYIVIILCKRGITRLTGFDLSFSTCRLDFRQIVVVFGVSNKK